jgi:thiamine pyrophosphate-dependent acetolactate synthase large subunit-like protein
MAEIDGGRVVARQLKAAGIDTIFGVVAGPTVQIMAGAAAEGLKVVGARHEENGAFMAMAWGYVKKKPGVLVTGSGPGTTNAFTPLYAATETGLPLVVLGGAVHSNSRGIGGFQEADQVSLMAPAAKWATSVDSIERVAELTYLALGKSITGRPGGVYLDFPGEIPSLTIDESKVRLRGEPRIARPAADAAAIEEAADLLANAARPLVVFGKGATWADAGPAIQKIVDRGIPYVASPMARGTVPDDHPSFMNSARSAALRGADVVMTFGARYNWIFQFGRKGGPDQKIIQVDIVPEEFYSAANIELGIVADVRVAAEQLDEALASRNILSVDDGTWMAELVASRDKNEQSLVGPATSNAVPIDPHRVIGDLRDVLPRGSSISEDGETSMGIARQLLPSYASASRFNASTTACIGTGVPFAIGAKLARPDFPSVAVLGDYAFGAAAIAVETAARVGANVVFLVINNEGIVGHTLQDNMFPEGADKIATLLPAHYEKMIEMVEGHSERVERPEDIKPALERAIAADKVALVHVLVDPKAVRLSGGAYLG